jgi:D-sedoheptulose 7-phosphate isomerase
MTFTENYLGTLCSHISQIDHKAIEHVVDLFWSNYQDGARLVFCGNGGSAATASHLPADFQKNILLEGVKSWECMSLVDSVPLLTAWSNDAGYENVFAGQARVWVRPGDILVAISGSGNSPNIIAAVETANELGAITVGWCGFGGGKLASIAHHAIVSESNNMQMVEDIHMIIGHMIFTELRDRLRAEKKHRPTAMGS